MSLLPLFPDLQQISRGLFELNSSVTFQYSYSAIRLSWNPPTPKQKWIGLAILSLFAIICVGFCMYAEAYGLLIPLILMAIIVWLFSGSTENDVHRLRLQNTIRVDIVAQNIVVEHLNEAYRQQVATEQLISFHDVQAVRVQASGYAGILYLELADTSQLFLLEVEAENIAQLMAVVLRRIIGLPEPVQRPWWKF